MQSRFPSLMRRRRPAPGLAVGLALAALLGVARADDLLGIYAQARAADPVLAQARAQRGVQAELLAQSRAPLLPQWSLSAEEERSEGQRSRSAASHLSQVLVDLSQLRSLDAAQARLEAEDARLRAAEQQLCARVAQAYFQVLSAQSALETAEANEAAFAQQVSQAQTRYEAGLSALVDVEQARAYHGLSRGQTQQARQQLADARQALAEITGQLPGSLQALSSQLPTPPLQPQDAEAWVARALSQQPLLQAAQGSLRASERRIDAARAGHLPTLSLGLDSQRRSGFGVPPADAGRMVNTVAVRLSVPLFAGGVTQSLQRQAVHERDQQREQLEATRRALVRETQAQVLAVKLGIEQVASSAAAAQAAERALAATRAGQALGTRSMTDLLLAIQTHAQARNAHAQARHAYVLATLQLQAAVGQLGEAELARVNQLLQGAS